MRWTSPPKNAAWAPWLKDDSDWQTQRDAVAAHWLTQDSQREGSHHRPSRRPRP